MKVEQFIFMRNFVILEREIDLEVPVNLGRHYLATERELVVIQSGELISG